MSKHGSELGDLIDQVSTGQPEGEGSSYLLEHDGGRHLVEMLLETISDFFWSRVSRGDTCNNWLGIFHLNVANRHTVLGNSIITSLNRFGCSGTKSGSRQGCGIKSGLGDQARNLCPELLSHQELRHPGGPGEPLRAVKGWDRVKSGLGRHVDRWLKRA